MSPWIFLECVAWYVIERKQDWLAYNSGRELHPLVMGALLAGRRNHGIIKRWPQALRDFNLTLAVIGKAAEEAYGEGYYDAQDRYANFPETMEEMQCK